MLTINHAEPDRVPLLFPPWPLPLAPALVVDALPVAASPSGPAPATQARRRAGGRSIEAQACPERASP